jgi:hypothetical protein
MIRRYTRAARYAESVARGADEIGELLRGVDGFVGFVAIRDGDRLVTITLGASAAGVEEAAVRVAGWIRAHRTGTPLVGPETVEGDVIVNIGR